MERSALITLFIGVLMVVTGSLNTLAAKWADNISVAGRKFDHPYFQATCMFFGEFSCLVTFFIVYYVKRFNWRKRRQQANEGPVYDFDAEDDEEPQISRFNPFIFLPPACCDVLSTSLQYIGLNLTTASSYQMLRGAIIIFTGLLSVAFLRMRLQGFKWLGMILVTFGLVIVGLCDIYESGPGSDIYAVITGKLHRFELFVCFSGDLLIIMAQIIGAVQMVTEQMFLERYDVPPLLAVGLEGLFGMVILSFLMIPMYWIRVPEAFSTDPEHRMENVIDAFKEIGENPMIAVALMGTIVSIAFFNFAGVSVTKVIENIWPIVVLISAIVRNISNGFGLSSYISDLDFVDSTFPREIYSSAVAWICILNSRHNDLLFGPRFRRDVLPKISYQPAALCCVNFCGLSANEHDEEQLIVEPEDEENN
ncbi:UAA transporter family protein [Aphelenchoides besseyi]|nr:UAA transporter family protein [Aphelenchoides besseyi]